MEFVDDDVHDPSSLVVPISIKRLKCDASKVIHTYNLMSSMLPHSRQVGNEVERSHRCLDGEATILAQIRQGSARRC